jgi:CDP-diacylglycerol--glycerol-3-phosphate 3-phosphatidyltransferase/cardiolipin synthase
MGEGRAGTEGRQGQRRRALGAADAISLARVPLAVVFVVADGPEVRLPVLTVAALSDLLDGWLARRLGPSRIGAVLDPITDKLFMVAAFIVLAASRALTPLEIVGVLIRDIVTPLGYLATVALRRPVVVPARAGGKLVTAGQSLTLVAWLIDSPYLRPMAWATAAMAIYALADYGLLAARRVDSNTQGGSR